MRKGQINRISIEEVEAINKKKYNEVYPLPKRSIFQEEDRNAYSLKLAKIRLQFIEKYGKDKEVVDLGCGTGDYLFESKNIIKNGIGIDFSLPFLKNTILKKHKMNSTNINFIGGNAKQIPYKEKTFDLCYAFVLLYGIPGVEKVLLEAARVLKPKGIAILEFGNLYSLNTIVCRAYPEWAIPCHITVKHMKKILRDAGLKIIEWRSFQILPLWGDRPQWLKPLLKPGWKIRLQKELNGKMRDEWLSELPLLRNFAFRQVVICKKKI